MRRVDAIYSEAILKSFFADDALRTIYREQAAKLEHAGGTSVAILAALRLSMTGVRPKIQRQILATPLPCLGQHRQPDMSKVAESCFSFLHMEVVNTLLSPTPTAEELQHAGRRLEVIGYQVGERLAERYTKDRPRFADTLEIIKFICKDFWYEIYGKQIDKLQTNNRGVYMLQDNKHRLLVRCSPAAERQSTAKQMGATYGKFPCGLIRGALYGLGVSSSVGVEMTDVSACQFTVRIQIPQPPQPPTPQQDTSRE